MTDSAAVEDKTLPVVVYVLYLLGLTHGLTMIIGLIIAYVCRDNAGPRMASHYTWLIRTFWTGLIGWVVGGLLLMVGVPLSFILIGVPIVVLGGLVFAAAWALTAVRLVVGLTYAARDEAYPRPYAVLL